MNFNFKAIGVVRGGGDFPQQAPRQSVYARNRGYIELLDNGDYRTALRDLEGFERIWLIFVFDRNSTWKPLVRPPYGCDRKVGVFATRSPYRPNPLGISAVELEGISGSRIYIRNFDLLSGTPVVDIKPYIPEADAFPESRAGWRDDVPPPPQLEVQPQAAEQLEKLLRAGGPDLADVARIQLTLQSENRERQRISGEPGEMQILAFRTWRILFRREPDKVIVTGIFSGYTSAELISDEDPYGDKELHRRMQDFLLQS